MAAEVSSLGGELLVASERRAGMRAEPEGQIRRQTNRDRLQGLHRILNVRGAAGAGDGAVDKKTSGRLTGSSKGASPEAKPGSSTGSCRKEQDIKENADHEHVGTVRLTALQKLDRPKAAEYFKVFGCFLDPSTHLGVLDILTAWLASVAGGRPSDYI